MAEHLGLIFVGLVIGLIISVFLPAVVRRYGESLVDSLYARRIEREKAMGRQPVDRENAEHRAALDRSKQLRIAAIDKRLAVHQEAFTLWRNLFKSMHTPSVHSVVMECQDWWEKNCLYLEPAVSDDFSRAYSDAGSHASLLASCRGQADAGLVQENWQRIIKPGKTIPKAVSLPSIFDDLEASKDAEGNILK